MITAQPRFRPRNFYLFMALAAAAVVAVGFAPTYYLRSAFGSPPLSLRVHLHGAIFTMWIVLFLAQTTLVRSGRVGWHSRLGVAGGLIAFLMVCLGSVVAIDAANAGKSAPGVPPLNFLASQLLVIAQFAGLVVLALCLRRHANAHKRLMVLATISILTPALARVLLLRMHIEKGVPLAATLVSSLVLAILIFDLRTLRRVHPATLWGGLLVLVSPFVRSAIGQTALWHSIAVWLTRHG